MQNQNHQSLGPSKTCAVELVQIWDVHENSAYDVIRPTPNPEKTHILWHIQNGEGNLWIEGHGCLTLPPDTVLLVENPKIQRYCTAEESWNFRWFEIRLRGTPPLPLNQCHPITSGNYEDEVFATIVQSMKSTAETDRRHASSLVCMLMHRWACQQHVTPKDTHLQEMINRVIRQMHENMTAPISVEDMAATCHLGVRRFRQVFRNTTGQSPKQYYDHLRLNTGREMLRMGVCNINQAAAQLGFSSPFHFSKAFRKAFGVPPSALKPSTQT